MLKINNLTRNMGNFSLTDISLTLSDGDYYVLLGRSGSGKSQLLETIAGLGRTNGGSILLDEVEITHAPIQDRNVGIVFQDFAIFPHLTVFDNISYPLKRMGLTRSEIRERVEDISRGFNISAILNRKPENLSGGEKQRVALARTLVRSPRLLLLDEPLASIDASLKDDIRRLLRKLNKEGQTIIHVTHDYREALSLATRIGVIHNGRMIQEGSPDDVFENPVNKFVARYAGNRNFFRISFEKNGSNWNAITRRGTTFTIEGGNYQQSGLLMIKEGKIWLSREQTTNNIVNSFRGVIKDILPTGHGVEMAVEGEDIFYVEVISPSTNGNQFSEGENVWINIPSGALKVIPD